MTTWNKKFKGNESGGAWIYVHPLIPKAIVQNLHGISFDGEFYNSLDKAKSSAIKKYVKSETKQK